MEPYFSLQRWLTLSLLRLRFAGDTFSKKTQISLKENKWGYLLLIIKSKLSSKDDKFGNLVVTSVSLRASHCLALESEIDGVVVVQSFSCVWCFATPWTAASRLPCSTLSLGVCSNSCPLSRWYNPNLSSSVTHFPCPQYFPASGSFPKSQLFVSGGQRTGVSASASVLPVNMQDWFPLGLTGLISLLSKGLSSVFSSTTIQQHQYHLNKY